LTKSSQSTQATRKTSQTQKDIIMSEQDNTAKQAAKDEEISDEQLKNVAGRRSSSIRRL
jgi:hypothetical protein